MQDLNQIRITGTITNEPKFLATQTNGLMARFSVAVHRPDPSKAIDFLTVIAWDDVAHFVQDNFHEQSRISLVGTVQYQKYKGSDGVDRRSYRIVAQDIVDPAGLADE